MAYPVNTLVSINSRTANTINALESRQLTKTVFRAFTEAVLDELSLLLLVYSGQRSYAEQWELRKKYLEGGPRAAPPGGSYHNFGLAIDVIPVFYDGKPNWELPQSVWTKIQAIANRFGLESGASFGDPGHFKYKSATSLAVLRNSKPGWQQYGVLEKQMGKGTAIKRQNWIQPALYIGIGGLVIYGIFEYTKRRA